MTKTNEKLYKYFNIVFFKIIKTYIYLKIYLRNIILIILMSLLVCNFNNDRMHIEDYDKNIHHNKITCICCNELIIAKKGISMFIIFLICKEAIVQ